MRSRRTTQLEDQITAAIGAHSLWKGRLLRAIDTGASEFDPANVDPDDRCEFGQWLHRTIDAAQKTGNDYKDVKALHATFHKEAARILRLAVTGKKDEARTLLQGDYAKLSMQLVQKLSDWKRKG